MSIIKIRTALETALDAVAPALLTAWENADFTPPPPSTPYQQINFLFAPPSNATYGGSYQQSGALQVKLLYPPQAGPASASERAELLRTSFARGTSYTHGGLTAVISDTPEITAGVSEEGRYAVTVKINFFSNIT